MGGSAGGDEVRPEGPAAGGRTELVAGPTRGHHRGCPYACAGSCPDRVRERADSRGPRATDRARGRSLPLLLARQGARAGRGATERWQSCRRGTSGMALRRGRGGRRRGIRLEVVHPATSVWFSALVYPVAGTVRGHLAARRAVPSIGPGRLGPVHALAAQSVGVASVASSGAGWPVYGAGATQGPICAGCSGQVPHRHRPACPSGRYGRRTRPARGYGSSSSSGSMPPPGDRIPRIRCRACPAATGSSPGAGASRRHWGRHRTGRAGTASGSRAQAR
jgi:hypothetical protein